MADSSTGGYLPPTGAPADDAALDALLQAAVAAITGLPGQMVRPRWQPLPPPEPALDADWCAIGVLTQARDFDAVLEHDPAGDGLDRMRRNATLDVLASFYGPHAGALASRLADGLSVPQNREALASAGILLGEVGAARQAPDLLHEQWRRRVDLPIELRRRIDRTYPVLNLLSAAGAVRAAGLASPWNTER